MATANLRRPLNNEGFVGVTGTAQRSGTVTVSALNPRESLYLRCGAQPDIKIWPTRPLPVTLTFAAGDDFEAMAMEDMTVTYTLTLDPPK